MPIPAKSTLGTLTLVTPNGGAVDLIANHSIRSGKIAAYLDMRDNVLVEAQNQLDGLAAAMAQALSDDTVAGPRHVGPQAGFDVDTAGWLNGNRINLTYTDTRPAPSTRSRSSGSTIRRRCRSTTPRRPTRRRGDRRRFLRRARLGGSAAQRPVRRRAARSPTPAAP